MTKSRKRKTRTNKIKRRATIKPYLEELRRSRVPPLVIQQVAPLIAILIVANKKGDDA